MIAKIRILPSFVLLINFVFANKNFNRIQYRTIESYMNASADPCIDFYEYACGNWERVHRNASYTDTFEFVDYQIDEEYGHILKYRRKNESKQNHFTRQVLSYYKSCISLEEFQPMLYLDWMSENENIAWPDMEENSKDISFDWLHMLGTLRKYGLNGILVSESVLQKRDDSTRFLIDIDRPAMDDEFEALKYSQFEVIMEYFGIEKSRKIRNLWHIFEKFELKLIELYEIEDDIGFEEVRFPSAVIPHWIRRYLKNVFGVERFDRQMLITISNRAYLHALFRLLQNYDDEFICRYLMIRFLWHLNYNGPTSFEKSSCISNVRQQMPLAMAWLYEEHSPALVREIGNIKRIFESLRLNFLRALDSNSNNFAEDVLAYLKEKLRSMQLKIGNIPRNPTVESIELFYANLSLSANDFYANHLKLLKFNARKHHGRLNIQLPSSAQEFYHLEDTDLGATSTPYFLQRNNLVIMPLTLLHLPLYHPQLHDVYKFSLIGFLLAHEITHGFDDSGLDYDQFGNMRETAERIKENRKFDNNFECLLSKNPHVIDEKISDVSGLRWAFETYFSNASENAILSFSKIPQNQLFIRNFALFFCGAVSNDETLANSSHGTWRSRLNDAVQQFPKFGQVYNCPAGSPMNPTRKCQLWR